MTDSTGIQLSPTIQKEYKWGTHSRLSFGILEGKVGYNQSEMMKLVEEARQQLSRSDDQNELEIIEEAFSCIPAEFVFDAISSHYDGKHAIRYITEDAHFLHHIYGWNYSKCLARLHLNNGNISEFRRFTTQAVCEIELSMAIAKRNRTVNVMSLYDLSELYEALGQTIRSTENLIKVMKLDRSKYIMTECEYIDKAAQKYHKHNLPIRCLARLSLYFRESF